MVPAFIKKDATILFQGDSITDCGRRDQATPMGKGYANIVSSWLQAKYPELNLTFINKGISGNRVKDLEARWKVDCLDLAPDVLSVLIGVNDTWRKFDSGDSVSAEVFYEKYRVILDQAKENSNPTLILCEPFLLPYPIDRKAWREDLDPKIAAVRELAREYEAILVPFDSAFAGASTKQPCAYWAGDGVHPTPAGHALMAQTWLQHVFGI